MYIRHWLSYSQICLGLSIIINHPWNNNQYQATILPYLDLSILFSWNSRGPHGTPSTWPLANHHNYHSWAVPPMVKKLFPYDSPSATSSQQHSTMELRNFKFHLTNCIQTRLLCFSMSTRNLDFARQGDKAGQIRRKYIFLSSVLHRLFSNLLLVCAPTCSTLH